MGNYGTWMGMPREQIPWYPTVDLTKCAGCRKCVEFCSHGVYSWNEEANTPTVIEPLQCVVGCSSCAQQCEKAAIMFPPLTVLKAFMSGT